MRNIPTKIDNVGDELPATEFNSDQVELENAVTSTDQTLDGGSGPDTDLNMLGKAMAMYSSAGQFYADSGGVNNYVLARSTNLKTVPEYKDGMVVIFKAAAANTGASTINVSSFGSRSLTQFDGSPLDPAQIVTNDYISAIYNETNDRFELMGSGVSEFAPGTVMLFGNTTAPLGWIRKTDWQDSAMFCYKATGTPSSGGAANPQTIHNHSGPSHTHTMQNHTHDGPSHTHQGGSMILGYNQMPAHTHGINGSSHAHSFGGVTPQYGTTGTEGDRGRNLGGNYTNQDPLFINSDSHSHSMNAAGSNSPHSHGANSASGTDPTGAPSNNTSAPSGTGNTGVNSAPYFQEIIAAVKE